MTMIKSEMAGTGWKVLVAEGDEVSEGQEVVILESMKMEIPVEAEASGVVKRVVISEGDFIELDADLVEIE